MSFPQPFLLFSGKCLFRETDKRKEKEIDGEMPLFSLPLLQTKIKKLLCDASRKEMISVQVIPWLLNPNAFQPKNQLL